MISVIMPAYNAEKWLDAAVRSVLHQTFEDLELIIVNDGSTDNTGGIADSFTDPRIKVIHKINGGVSVARNTGMDAATGTYLAFMDSDDVMWPQNLSVKLETLRSQGVDWVFSDLQRCDMDMIPFGDPDIGTDGDVVRTILGGRGAAVPGFSSNVLMHRKCYEGGARFDPELSNSADQDMALTLAKDFSYYHIPQVLFGYRILPGSMSKNIAVYEKDHRYLFNKAKANGLLNNRSFRRYCLANAYWAIGGSWWKNAHEPLKAIPYLFKAILLRPSLLLRPITKS